MFKFKTPFANPTECGGLKSSKQVISLNQNTVCKSFNKQEREKSSYDHHENTFEVKYNALVTKKRETQTFKPSLKLPKEPCEAMGLKP